MHTLSLAIRWSEHEATRSYARPFGVELSGASPIGMIAVSGRELVYFAHFQEAVLRLGGVLLPPESLPGSGEPQRRWLDLLAATLPTGRELDVFPVSAFDDEEGRMFRFSCGISGRTALVGADALLRYQELQGVIAHQTGMLFRREEMEALPTVEDTADALCRYLSSRLAPPARGDEWASSWPWA